MIENDGPHPLDIKLGELTAKIKLTAQTGSFDQLAGNFDESTKEQITKVVKNREAYGAASADIAWVLAMQKAGVDPLIIAQIWDDKDQQVREMRDNSQKQL